MELFLRINLSIYFQASFFYGILQISRIADLQHWIFLNFSDILLMFLEEIGVIFPFDFSLIWKNSEGVQVSGYSS